jgi:hypothetical protein
LQKLNTKTKLQKLKRRRNTKLQKLIPNYRNRREEEIPKQLQRQNKNTKLQKLIPNCRNRREDEIPKQLQRENINTKLQKLKRRRNTKTIAETEQKYQIAEAEESKIKFQILILQPQAQNLIFILHLLIGQTTHV